MGTAELIFLCRYFDSSPSLSLCMLQVEFSYFLLVKFLCSLVLISWITARKFFQCNQTIISFYLSVIAIVLLTAWSILLTVNIANYRNRMSHHDNSHCNQ